MRVAGSALLARPEAGGTADDRGQLAGPLERTSSDDRSGNGAGPRLLAIILEDADDLGLVGLVQELGRGQPGLAHPHVERTVGREGKAAVRPIELHRGDADIEGDGVDLPDAAISQHSVHLAEAFVDKGEAGVRDERTALVDRIGVAIERNHPPRPRPEHGARVAASSERAVDRGVAFAQGECGDHLVDQHRHMWGLSVAGAGHADAPLSSRRKRAMSFKSSGMRLSASNSLGFQIWKVSPAPRNSARSPIWPFKRIIGGKRIRPELS